MTKIYEALQNAQKERAPLRPASELSATRVSRSSRALSDKLLALGQRIEALVSSDSGIIVAFVGAQESSDSTHLAYETAALWAARRGRKTLLLSPGPARYLRQQNAVITWERAIAEARGIDETMVTEASGLSVAQLSTSDYDVPRLMSQPEFAVFIEAVRKRFDIILVDAPAFGESSIAREIAGFTDGVVFVIEAGRTRWQAIRGEMDRLEEQGTAVLGAVYTRQRHYIPHFIYRRL